MFGIPTLLAKIPASWSTALGSHWVVRVLLLAVVIRVVIGLQAFAFSRLPDVPSMFANSLSLVVRGRRRVVRLADVDDIFVELRPAPDYQAFVVELSDGSRHDLCPVGWSGAPNLFRAIDRVLKRRQRRALRKERRLARRARRRKRS